MIRLLSYTAPSPAADLALEEAIHLAVESGSSQNTWRIWQARATAVILGTGQEAAKEVESAAAAKENVPVLRRHSGGGAVIIGPGIINYSAFYLLKDLPGTETIRGAMSAALQSVIKALSAWKLKIQEAGSSDLAVITHDGTLRKIAGNAQARKRISVMVHGTLLADPEWAQMTRLLRFPSKTPDYRAGREHRAFLTSLKENNAPCDLKQFAEGLTAALTCDKAIETLPTAAELVCVEQLMKEKYGNSAWNLRR
ncbi:MAG: biotin/lipoate A/B protein ligase family protein [Planctomycetota bacterium]